MRDPRPSEPREAAIELEELAPGLTAYLAGRFGEQAGVARAAPLLAGGEIKKGGYGIPYVLSWTRDDGTTERLVLESVRAGGFGHEDRADRAAIVVRAADDSGGLPRGVPVIGYGALRPGGAIGLDGSGEPFLLMPFVDGQPYAQDLERIAAAGSFQALDELRVLALADYLAALHREPVSHPTWYRRRLRDLGGLGECIAGVADSYPSPCGFITPELLERVERLCLAWRYRLRDRGDRLRAVHGDFHPWNLLFQEGAAFRVLDRSRGAVGDPADDVAALTVNYVFFALRTRGAFEGPFAELFRLFWERYLGLSGDRALADVIAPHFAFRALVVANPVWYPNESETTRRALFRFLLSVLEAPSFSPAEIPAHLSRAEP